MARHEGWLDYGSGRYKLVGCPGGSDWYLHAGECFEVWQGHSRQWVAVEVQADNEGRWYFLDGQGERVTVPLGVRAR